jgi:hypothetical protein
MRQALLAGCLLLGLSPASAQQSGDEAQLEALRAEILKMIGNAPCANLVHCRVLALGVRPCGGPDEYLAYNGVLTDKAALENKALEFALIQEDLLRAKSLAGPCVVLPEPRLSCREGRCRVD